MKSRSTSAEPRFHPELLLGYDAIEPTQRRVLCDYLLRVVRDRGFPLNVANLWNALYFGYDLDEHGYFGHGINIDRIPKRRYGSRDRALPVGGFVRVETPTRDLWAEVVYKEGRHPEVECDWVPDYISGAPAQPTQSEGQTVAIVREALVLDYDAFGPDWNDLSRAQYARLLRRERWLDSHGHLVVDAVYQPETADDDDATFYARYLFEEHRDGLLEAYLEDHVSDGDVWSRLLTSLDTVERLAQDCTGLVSWRSYYFDRTSYEARVLDTGGDTHFGADELRHLFKRVSTLPRRAQVGYTAIGPQILDVLGRDGLDDEERVLLEGPNYVTAVCHANVYIRNRLSDDAPTGILSNGNHLRLDDAWQSGGIWRAEDCCGRSSSLLRVPPTIPMGLGYSSTQTSEPLEPDLVPPIISSSSTGWRTSLTRLDLDSFSMRLSPSVAQALGGKADLKLRLNHGEEPAELRPVRYDQITRVLLDVEWPLDAYPGIVVYGNLESHGTIIKLRTKRLSSPITIGGHVLHYEFNESVYRRNLEPLPRQTFAKVTTLTELIHRAFRTRGRPAGNGGRGLTIVEVLNAILGPYHSIEESRPVRLALQTLDLEFNNGVYTWYPRVTRSTRAIDRAVLEAYGEEEQQQLQRLVRRHWVLMHLRRLRPGETASPEKRAGYKLALREARMHGVRSPVLPIGFTWVKSHARGDRESRAEPSTNQNAGSIATSLLERTEAMS